MPRDVSADLETHFSLPRRTFAFALWIDPVNGAAEGYTSHDRDLTIDGLTYYSNSNILPSAIPTTLSLPQMSSDVRIIFEVARFTEEKVRTHYYENATYRMFAVNRAGDLTQQVDLMGGRFGKVDVDQTGATIELQDWGSLVNMPQGYITSQLCQAMEFGRGFCYNDPALGGLGDGPNADDSAHHRVALVSSSITSARQFVLDNIVGSTPANDWANDGVLEFVTGNNAGIRERVKRWYDTGEVILALPLPYLPEEGDDVILYEGCDRTWDGTRGCKSKNNTLNAHMMHPFIPMEAIYEKNG